jgi:hypothetical protein
MWKEKAADSGVSQDIVTFSTCSMNFTSKVQSCLAGFMCKISGRRTDTVCRRYGIQFCALLGRDSGQCLHLPS